ncbi:MAG: hypothetical protein IVW57_09925, partial [Ktedonobacterales bacterium]|nr:hypothetical protein [Ktedonobacterales bacterium]
AGSLTLGERVRRVDGGTATVVGLRAVAGTAPRWDLTVSALHDFAVGTGAYVVHNCGGDGGTTAGSGKYNPRGYIGGRSADIDPGQPGDYLAGKLPRWERRVAYATVCMSTTSAESSLGEQTTTTMAD